MNLAKETIQIQGMSCAACVRRVEQGLSTLEGVNSASVNFATERASVEYDPDAVTPAALRAKVKELGYDVVETSNRSGREAPEDLRFDRWNDLRSLCASCGRCSQGSARRQRRFCKSGHFQGNSNSRNRSVECFGIEKSHR